MTCSDAIVSVAVRSPLVLGAVVTSMVSVPLPDSGLRVTQSASADACHAHASWVRTSIPTVSPEAGAGDDGEETAKVHSAAAWPMSTRRSAIAMAACRGTGSALGATLNVTVPSPCPLAPESIEIHPACADAVQLHSRATVTAALPVPPAAPNADDDAVTDA